MTVEQLIEGLQELIGRGSISPSAEIKTQDLDGIERDIIIDYCCTSFNCLRLEAM